MKAIHKILPLTICLLLILTGCAKVTKAETETVPATIVSAKHEKAKIIPYVMIVNKQTIIRNQIIPEKHIVVVCYKDIEKSFNNEVLYEKCKNCVGETIEMNLVTKHYDNGKVTYSLELIEKLGDTNG